MQSNLRRTERWAFLQPASFFFLLIIINRFHLSIHVIQERKHQLKSRVAYYGRRRLARTSASQWNFLRLIEVKWDPYRCCFATKKSYRRVLASWEATRDRIVSLISKLLTIWLALSLPNAAFIKLLLTVLASWPKKHGARDGTLLNKYFHW